MTNDANVTIVNDFQMYILLQEINPNPNGDNAGSGFTPNTRFEAKHFRFVVLEWHNRIAMRVELRTCQNGMIIAIWKLLNNYNIFLCTV